MGKQTSSSKRLLVTGGAGFIGSNFIRLALSSGARVLNLDNLTYAAGTEISTGLDRTANYQFLRTDIVDSKSVSAAMQQFSPNAVVHFAAETHVDRSITDSNPFVRSNIVGTSSLLQAALHYWRGLPDLNKQDFRFIHISTDEVYGSLGDIGKFSESSPYDPHSPYAASKAAADHLVRAYSSTYQLPSIVIHPSNNYGPNQHPEKLVPMTIRSCLQNQPIPVYGDGKNVRDWLYVEDLCDAIVKILNEGKSGSSYNVGGGNEWRNLHLVEAICDLIDEIEPPGQRSKSRRSLIQFVSDRPGHDFRYSLDCTKISAELGWKPIHSFTEGLRKTIRWYLQNRARLGMRD